MEENFSSIPGCPIHGGKAPKARGLPFLGNLMDLRNRPLELLIDNAEQHGSVFRLHAFGFNVHVVSGQTAIDLVMRDDETQIHRQRLFDAFDSETSVDIFSTMGTRHGASKNLIRLGYSRQVTAQFVNRIASRLGESIKEWPTTFKAMERICLASSEAISIALTPEKLPIPLEVFEEYGHRLMMVNLKMRPKQVFHLPRHKKQKRQVEEALEFAISAHRNGKYDADPDTHILDAFIQTEVDGKKLSDSSIVGMGLYALVGSNIYCGRTATFMVYELLKNPGLLAEVIKEVDAAFDGEGVNADVLRRMTFLRATFQEAMRRYPLLPGMPFRAARDLVVDGYQIPQNDILLLTGLPNHFLAPGYKNASAFDPHRCLAPRNEHRNKNAYSPWGFRPRVCAAIGLSEIIIMTTVATILRNLKLELLRPGYEMKLTMRPLICPKDGLPLKVSGSRSEQEFSAKRSYLLQRQVDKEQLADPHYEFELPRLESEDVVAGTRVFDQGDMANDFYIIILGQANVIKTENGQSTIVASLAAGETFGEIGLLKSVPRTAAVEASTDLKLLRLNREQFLQIVSDSDLVASELGYLIQRRFLEQTLLRTMPSLNLAVFAKFAKEFEFLHFQPGEVVFEEGDAADAMYIIVAGEFEVVRQLEGQETLLKTCAVGEIIGEIGILQQQPRMATVRNSQGAGVLAKITREGTEAMLAESGQAFGELALLASKRLIEAVEAMNKMIN